MVHLENANEFFQNANEFLENANAIFRQVRQLYHRCTILCDGAPSRSLSVRHLGASVILGARFIRVPLYAREHLN